MSDADNAPSAAPQSSGFWPDETVDMLAALVIVTCVVLAGLWFVTGG